MKAARGGADRYPRDRIRRTGRVTLILFFGSSALALLLSVFLGFSVAQTLGAILVGGGAPAGLYVAWETFRAGLDVGGPDLGELADSLAAAIGAQWRAEAADRQLNSPYPLPLRWEAADSTVAEPWENLETLAMSGAGWMASPSQWAAGPDGLAGEGSQLVDVLARVPTGRLVVLGEPGYGKTMLMICLVLDLLARRKAGLLVQVPVLISAASWDPGTQDFRRWLAEQMELVLPGLGEPAPRGCAGATRIDALLEAGLILLILDGLDEIPRDVRGYALARIDGAIQPGWLFVATSRTKDYREAVRPPDGIGVNLHAAAVELRALPVAEVIRYLRSSAADEPAATRCGLIIAELSRGGPLAKTLAIPLMVGLARTIYCPRPGQQIGIVPEPAELCSLTSESAIKDYLLDAFIPAAYGAGSPPRSANTRSACQAEHWLTLLAADLEYRQKGRPDFAWWRMADAAPGPLPGLVAGLVAGVVGAIGLPSYLFPGIGLGLIATALVALLVSKRIKFGWRGVASGLAGGVIGGLIAAAVALSVFGPGRDDTRLGAFVAGALAFGLAAAPFSSFAAGAAGAFTGEITTSFYERSAIFLPARAAVGSHANLINGLGLGLLVGIIVGTLRQSTPARGLLWSRLGSACGVGFGLVLGLMIGFQAGIIYGIVAGLVTAVSGGVVGGLWYGGAISVDRAGAGPQEVLRRDRATFLVSLSLGFPLGISAMLIVAFSPSPVNWARNGLVAGFGVGLADLVAMGIVVAFFEACWGDYILARIWLAASRKLPWNLMSFAADAHKHRHVLRQTGTVYEFRHIELQHRLAARLPNPAHVQPGEIHRYRHRRNRTVLTGLPPGD